MIVIKIVLFLCWLAVFPFFVGSLFNIEERTKILKMIVTLVTGIACCWSIFEVLALIATFATLSFEWIVLTYGGVLLILSGIGIIKCMKRKRQKCVLGKMDISWSMVLALILIVFQTAVAVLMTHMDLDDAYYVAAATTAMSENTITGVSAFTGLKAAMDPRYALSPFPVFLAFISKCSMIHPAIVAHTVMPAFFIPFAYSIYYLIGRRLFQNKKEETGIFLFFIAVINMFSYYSTYTQGTFLLIRIWQGKAVLANILLPAIFYCCIRYFDNKEESGVWRLLLCLIVASGLVSSMGIMLAPLMVGIFIVYQVIIEKKWKKAGIALACCTPSFILAGVYIMIR